MLIKSKMGEPRTLGFAMLCLFTYATNGNAQQLPDYTLHPGDKIDITVWKEEDLHRTVLVRPDGKISFPLTNDIDVSGRTVTELQNEVMAKLKKYMPEPVVTVSVDDIGGNAIYIIGQVNKAGVYVMSRQLNVLQALSMAAGTTPFAALNDIIIIRSTKSGQKVMPFHYSDVSKGRSLEQNVLLESGDVIVVP